MILTTKCIDGVPYKNDFNVRFTSEEEVWMTKNRCRVSGVEARRFPRSDTMEFCYTTDNGGTGGFYCKPEEFFVELHKKFYSVPVETITVKTTLPGFDDETFE